MSASPVLAECLRLADEQLASTHREMDDVRLILADAIDRLMRDRSSATGLQFQDICDQLLAHACGRLRTLREEIGVARSALMSHRDAPIGVAHRMYDSLLMLKSRSARPVHAAHLEPGSIEVF